MAKESINILLEQKKEIESQLLKHERVLKENKVTLQDSLLDRDGFPRGDIDIPTIRAARVGILHLQNDLKEVMSKIETSLHDLHANMPSDRSAPEVNQLSNSLRAFAFVNAVTKGSPACTAGLQQGDQILRFGSLQELRFEELSRLAELVRDHEEKPIAVQIRRLGNTELNLTVTPSYHWQDGQKGPGLLGCHILPLN